MSNQIELRQLYSFLVLARELHFRNAAEKLFISQPGLSKQIQQLEDRLGVVLLERNQRNVRLTASGLYLKEQVAYLQGFLEHTFTHLKHLEHGLAGEVRIGFVGSAMQKVIPTLIQECNKHYPNLLFALDEMSNRAQIEALQNYQIDLGFVRLVDVPSGIILKPILEENFSVVLPKKHSISKQNFNTIGQLKEEAFILFSTDYSSTYYNKIMSIFTDAGFSPRVSHKSIHANTIFRLVESGLGVAIVPKSLTFGVTKSIDIQIIDLTQIPQKAILSVAWRKGRPAPVLEQVLGFLPVASTSSGDHVEL